VYQEALSIELRRRDVPFEREVSLAITYKDEPLRCAYRADFVCYGEITVELKALAAITTSDQAQLLNYLKATGA
jgi:GxxExxY protein